MPPRSALLSELYRLTSPPPDDAELLRRWVDRREEDAFTALVSRHGRRRRGCRSRFSLYPSIGRRSGSLDSLSA